MAKRQIRQYGDDILRKKAKPVKHINDGIISLLDDMLDTLRERNGLGLAAPQVGMLKRVAIVEHENTLYEMINPAIVECSGEQRRNEACLSVPGKNGDLDRPAHVKVAATNRHGDAYEIVANDLLAAALCHELDHLDGILYLDRADEVRDNEKEE